MIHPESLSKAREEFYNLSKTYSKYNPSSLGKVLESWSDRRPIEFPLDQLKDFFVNVRRLRQVNGAIFNYLKDRDWRGAIVSVVGEYGSGKSQLGFVLKEFLQKRGVEVRRVFLDPVCDVRELILQQIVSIPAEKPVVLIVDELDQLLGDLARGDRKRFEDLADIVRWLTEGSSDRPPRGSAILMMSKRVRAEFEKDRALANRLLARSREYRLSMPDDERVEAARDATLKVMALFRAYKDSYRVSLDKHFSVLYPLLRKKAEDRALMWEIGGVIKYITEMLQEILDNIDPEAEMGSSVDLGRQVEELWREFMWKKLRAIPVTVSLGETKLDYLATLSRDRLSLPGAVTDAQYLVWTYKPEAGEKGNRLVQRIAVEIKTGRSWQRSQRDRDQLLNMLRNVPVLLFSIAEWYPDERTALEAEFSKAGHALGIIEVDPFLLKLSLLLRGEWRSEFLDKYGAFERDLREVLAFLLTPQAVQEVVAEGGEEEKSRVLLRASVSSFLEALRREVKDKSSKRVSTLYKILISRLDAVYSSSGLTPPQVPVGRFMAVLRILEREGLGSLSKTGKSLLLSKEQRKSWEELSESSDRRRFIEETICDVILSSGGTGKSFLIETPQSRERLEMIREYFCLLRLANA